MASFRRSTWDPPLLILQMLAMQFLFYATLGVLLVMMAHAINGTVSLQLVFSPKALESWQIIPAFLLNSGFGALWLWIVVRRAKQCVDFAVTAQVAHVIACSFYNGGVPSRVSWWMMNVVSATVMAVAGEYVCMHADFASQIEVNSPRKDTRSTRAVNLI